MEPRFRLRGTDWFLGVGYRFENTETTLLEDVPAEQTEGAAPVHGSQRVGGLSAVVAFDDRDNLYSATDGRLLEVYAGTFQPWLGSSAEFHKGKVEYRHYAGLTEGLVVAGRAMSEAIDGEDAPFFEQPYLELRGYARGEVRNDVTLWGEVEARYDLFWRIGVAAFAGVGWAGDTYSVIFEDSGRVAGGFGLRYNLRPDARLKIGVDLAWSPENKGAFYLRVGEAF